MAVNAATLRIVDEERATIAAILDDDTRRLVAAWARTFDQLRGEWLAAVEDVVAAAAGQDRAALTRLLRREARVRAALAATGREVERLASTLNLVLGPSTRDAVAVAVANRPAMIAAQLPAGTVTATFDRVPVEATRVIVARTTEQITALSRPLATAATAAMERQLVAAIALGDSPRRAAARMVAAVEGAFNGGLARALTIARTEVLDAYRVASLASDQANSDVLKGWVWSATLDNSTCPSCWAQHGGEHDLSEPGPLDHQNGRCARVPVTRSWGELGMAGTEPPPMIEPGADVFARLPAGDQLAIMGPSRLAALDAGVPFDALSSRRSTAGWRDSFGATSVADLVGAA